MKFKKKPVVIEAARWDGTTESLELIRELNSSGLNRELKVVHPIIMISTLEGNISASLGDWVIKGVQGELYPCKSDIFEATYERVE